MNKDWKGDKNSIFKTLGASNHTEKERESNDYYATDPKAVELLLENETFSNKIWEPACGEGHMSEVLRARGYSVLSTDLIDRGYGIGNVDFLQQTCRNLQADIITNPPYKYAKEFAEKALEIVSIGNKVALFVKLTFLESKPRKQLFLTHPPKTVYVSCSRLKCAKNGVFDKVHSAVAYVWVVWEKGYSGSSNLKWIN